MYKDPIQNVIYYWQVSDQCPQLRSKEMQLWLSICRHAMLSSMKMWHLKTYVMDTLPNSPSSSATRQNRVVEKAHVHCVCISSILWGWSLEECSTNVEHTFLYGLKPILILSPILSSSKRHSSSPTEKRFLTIWYSFVVLLHSMTSNMQNIAHPLGSQVDFTNLELLGNPV